MVKGSDIEQAAKNAAPSGAPTNESGLLGAIRRFADIDRDYAGAREQSRLAAQRRCEAALRRHAETLAALQKDTQSQMEQAYRTGAEAWDADRSDDSGKPVEDPNRQYIATSNTVFQQARERFAESLRALNKECEDAGTEFDHAARNAYRNYLRSLQDAWRALDVDGVVDAVSVARSLGLRP